MLLKSKEKRRFQRMGINIPIVIMRDEREIKGECIDLSGTGMQIKFEDKDLCVGDEVFIQLSTGHKLFSPLEVTAKVVRISETDNGFIGAVTFPALH
ncbi:MAG: PilZ domain-containing protein [Psychromonas sp.]|nr:PilZ domain-containing protein [Psychromonas sp.]